MMAAPEAEPAAAGAEPIGPDGSSAEQWQLRRLGKLAYWSVIAPLAARLPARAAYAVACAWGDLTFRVWPDRESEMEHLRRLRRVLGEELLPEDVEAFSREFCRRRACEVIDLMRLNGDGRALRSLVEIRGREHLHAALEGGRGAILCSAHVGSYLSTFSLLHADGVPLTNVGRWDWNYHRQLSRLEKRFWDLAYSRRVLRYRQRANLEPWQDRPQVAVQAAAALRANEAVMICSDPAPIPADRARARETAFLGGRARLVPGVVTLSEITGAPLLMVFSHRLPDYRHQVLEISPPVSLEGGTEAAFDRCVAAMDAAIRAHPQEWYFWFHRAELVGLGLLPPRAADA